MLDTRILEAVRTIGSASRSNAAFGNVIKDDPTGSVTRILEGSGFQVPEGFHVHVIDTKADFPDEPIMKPDDRDVYVFHPGGTIAHMTVKGDPMISGIAPANLSSTNRCCDCRWLCCVIIDR